MFKIKEFILGTPKQNVSNYSFPNGTGSIVPIENIADGIIITEDGRYVKILEVLPVNFNLKSEAEQLNIIWYMSGYLKVAPNNLQILVRTEPADIDTYCERMEEYYNSESNEKCRDMILQDAELVNYLAETQAVTRKFYLIFSYEGLNGEFEEIVKELNEMSDTARHYLDYCGLEVIVHENYNEFLFKTLYSVFQRESGKDIKYDELQAMMTPFHSDSKKRKTKEKDIGMVSYRDLLSPDTFDRDNKGFLITNGVYHSYLYVTGYGYPTETNLAWLSPLVEMGDGVSVSFHLSRKPKEQILKKISKTTMMNRARMKDIEDTRTDFEEMDDAISSGFYIKDKMNRDGEEFYYMHTIIEVTAPDKEILEARIRNVKNRSTSLGLYIRRADWSHEQCFKSMLPLNYIDSDIEKRSRRNVLTFGAAAAFPFSSYELCDEQGILLGLNQYNNSAVILDNYNSDVYSNGNMSIFGMTGAGKTYTILLMAMRLRMCGVQVFIIAPEKGFEYRGACEALGGQYIKLARGSTDCINIMEIRRTSLDIDENLENHEQRTDSVMLDVVQNVRTYLKLRYPDMTPEEGYVLNGAIQECYDSFSITKDNKSLLNPDGSFKKMPDLSDLYSFLEKYHELKNVAVIVKDLVNSGLAGQTNVDLKSQFIVIDTSAARDEDVASATFIGTVFIRDEISRSRTKKKAVFGDELWVIAGEQGNEQAADFVIRLVKTIRGYGGIFISATQNVIDYFALRDGKFGDSLLNNSRLKLLLQMEEAEAMKIKEKIGLSHNEVLQIIRSGRGQGLLCAGQNRIAVEIRSTQAQYDIITTNRSDLEKRVKKEEKQ